MRRLFLSLSVLLSIAYLGLLLSPNFPVAGRFWPYSAADLGFVPKVASIICLMLFVLASNAPRKLLAALLFSCAGDFLLGIQQLGGLKSDHLFLAGLVAFLGAHLCYISLFYLNRRHEPLSITRKIAIAAVILGLAIMLQQLWPSLGSMRLPVLIYTLALDAMAITAIVSGFPAIVAIGALSFVASDSLLALDRFAHVFLNAGPEVWTTYYVAQLLITLGISRPPVAAERKYPGYSPKSIP